jgi:hypothetical protein
MSQTVHTSISVIGIDIGKNVGSLLRSALGAKSGPFRLTAAEKSDSNPFSCRR